MFFLSKISLLFIISLTFTCTSATSNSPMPAKKKKNKVETKTKSHDETSAVFAGGCFWCTESDFEKIEGVKEVVSGYTGGPELNPTYKEVGSGTTGHTEAIRVYYDPKIINYAALVEKFWMSCDPTDNFGQFVDRGSQYRPGIFYSTVAEKETAEKSKTELQKSQRFEKPIVVKIEKLQTFWPAEDYHQDFYKKSPERYHSYRNGSGRDQFVEKHWKDK